VGHHTLKNTFKALPKIDDKAKLVEELASGRNRLHANAMSRSVADMCAVDEYRENKNSGVKPYPNYSCPRRTSF
jgi:hypothetical protein